MPSSGSIRCSTRWCWIGERTSGIRAPIPSLANEGQRWRRHWHPMRWLAGHPSGSSPTTPIPIALKNARIAGQRHNLLAFAPLPPRSCRPVFLRLLGLHEIDVHLTELVDDIVNLLRREPLRREDLIEFIKGDIAPLLCELDHPSNSGIGQVQQRSIAVGPCGFPRGRASTRGVGEGRAGASCLFPVAR
jgi:hypothetical protein